MRKSRKIVSGKAIREVIYQDDITMEQIVICLFLPAIGLIYGFCWVGQGRAKGMKALVLSVMSSVICALLALLLK